MPAGDRRRAVVLDPDELDAYPVVGPRPAYPAYGRGPDAGVETLQRDDAIERVRLVHEQAGAVRTMVDEDALMAGVEPIGIVAGDADNGTMRDDARLFSEFDEFDAGGHGTP
jgi:hypothetical protein